jgi:hypothetical protein
MAAHPPSTRHGSSLREKPMESRGTYQFYAREAHIIIMYLTVVSLISNKFCNGGSGTSRAIKFLYAPAPPPPSVWALKPPSWALVHKTTDVPMIYTTLCIMFWMRAYTLLGQVGGGWAQEILSFLGPKWHSTIGSMPFHRDQKTPKFQGPTPSHLPS